MYKDYRFINAGENEFYRWGKKALEKVEFYSHPKNGYFSIPCDGKKYWTFGTSTGKYGDFARWKDTIFPVNSAGYLYAKEGTEKGDKFIEMLNDFHDSMIKKSKERLQNDEDDEDEEV